MMTPRRWGAALVVLVALVALVLWLRASPEGAGQSAAGDPQATDTGQRHSSLGLYQWAPGMVLLYQAQATQETRALVGQGAELTPIQGELEVKLQFRLTALERRGDRVTFLLDIPRVDQLRWQVLGRELPAAQIQERMGRLTARVEMRTDGRLAEVSFAPGTQAPVAQLVQTLLGQFQGVVAPEQERWRVTYADGLVEGEASHELRGCQGERCRVEVRRGASGEQLQRVVFAPEGFTWERAALDVRHRFEVGRPGVLHSFQAHSQVELWSGAEASTAATFRGELALVHIQHVDPAVARGRLEKLKDYVRAQELGTGALPNHASRVQGMTLERARLDLLAYGPGSMQDQKKWMWQVTGLLNQDPSLSRAFGELFFEPEMSTPARALVLEVLGSVGHPQAQEAMRDVLGSQQARDSDSYPAFVQRFVLVQEPEEASMDFLAEAWQSQEGPARFGAVTALGAAVGRTHEAEPRRAARYIDQMKRGLAGARDSQEARAFLGALANTRSPEAGEALLGYTGHREARVRAEVAHGLGQQPSGRATEALVELASQDSDPLVQRTAARSLQSHQPSAQLLRSLRASMEAGRFDAASAQALLLSCERWLQGDVSREELGALLEAMLRLPGLERRTQHQASALLRSVRG